MTVRVLHKVSQKTCQKGRKAAVLTSARMARASDARALAADLASLAFKLDFDEFAVLVVVIAPLLSLFCSLLSCLFCCRSSAKGTRASADATSSAELLERGSNGQWVSRQQFDRELAKLHARLERTEAKLDALTRGKGVSAGSLPQAPSAAPANAGVPVLARGKSAPAASCGGSHGGNGCSSGCAQAPPDSAGLKRACGRGSTQPVRLDAESASGGRASTARGPRPVGSPAGTKSSPPRGGTPQKPQSARGRSSASVSA